MDTSRSRKPYPSDISDEEWQFAAPYLRHWWPRMRHNMTMISVRCSTACAGSSAPVLP